MAREQFEIASEVLRWARLRSGLNVADLEKDFRNYADWEKGSGGPSYAQLESLAEKLKVPVAVFFFPEPPTSPPIEETFRTLPNTTLDKLPSKIRLLLRKAKAFQLNISEICDRRNPAERLITRDLSFNLDQPLHEMATSARMYLNVSIEQQIQWPSNEEALKQWRDTLQDVGIFVFKDAFQAPEFSGFCLTDPVFPIIYVNNSSTKTRQIFTLFHELGHLLFSTSGIDSLHELAPEKGLGELIEVRCNAFAAEFLFPASAFENACRGMPASEETASALADRFHVSRESIFRRFLDQGKITSAVYGEAARKWADEQKVGGGGDYYRTKLAYLGKEYVGLALSAFHNDRITENQLAEYLDIKPKNITGLEDRFLSGVAA